MHEVRRTGGLYASTLIRYLSGTIPQGKTRLLLTSIPYFREVIVASFRCEHCGDTNNEIQAAGEIRR